MRGALAGEGNRLQEELLLFWVTLLAALEFEWRSGGVRRGTGGPRESAMVKALGGGATPPPAEYSGSAGAADAGGSLTAARKEGKPLALPGLGPATARRARKPPSGYKELKELIRECRANAKGLAHLVHAIRG